MSLLTDYLELQRIMGGSRRTAAAAAGAAQSSQHSEVMASSSGRGSQALSSSANIMDHLLGGLSSLNSEDVTEDAPPREAMNKLIMNYLITGDDSYDLITNKLQEVAVNPVVLEALI